MKKIEIVQFNLKEDNENFCNGLCNVTKSEIEDDYLINTSIEFEIGYLNLDDDFIRYIHSVIKHEVMHLYQVYNLKVNNKFKPESWVIGSLLPTFRNFLKEDYSKVILNLLYISLSHEIYSQLQQYYFYKKDNLKYQKIENIILDLDNFQIKNDLNDNEISEILNLKKFIIRGLKNNNNSKYIKDVDKSFWNENDVYSFLEGLNKYFKPIERFGGVLELERVKFRDSIKDKYCFDNNIKMIRISYLDKENIENILETKIN